jgi:RNA polymerase primary sigma factor
MQTDPINIPEQANSPEHEARTVAGMALPPGVAAEVLADPTGPLTVYFRDLARTAVLTREQEFVLAARIADLRRTLWRTTLNYPPFIAGICALAREVLGGNAPADALEAMTVAARKLRDRDLLIHRRAYEAARESLTAAMAEADVDGQVIDRVVADLGSIEAGATEHLSLKVKLPPRGSLPFMSYVAGVRAHYQALWAARSEFVKANLRLVVTIARRYNRGRMPLQDLVQEGNLGLMKAVDRFDPRKGCRFSTYGSWWIRHAVTRAIADKGRTVRLPVHMIDAYSKVLRARRQFEARHGRTASEPELAQACGVSPERLARMQVSLIEAPVSFDQRLSADTDMTLLDTMEDTSETPAPEALDHALHMQHLQELFARLTPFEADILRRRVGLDDSPEMTLKEIGQHYGLSRERIRQLQEQALGKIRDEFRERGLM